MRILLAVAAFIVMSPCAALADVGPPAHLQITEKESGVYTLQWRIPSVLPPRAAPSPQLPDGCRPEGDVSVVEQPGAWLFTQDWRCETGLAGQVVGMRYPFPDLALTTVVRVELLSGDRFAHVLSPGEVSWRVPMGISASDPLGEARRAVMAGLVHVGTSWIHVMFIVVLVLLGGASVSLRLVTAFTLAQVAAVVGMAVVGFAVGSFPPEMGFALAVALLSRQALRPGGERRGLVALAAAAGLLHGFGIRSIATGGAVDPDGGLALQLLFVLGVDAAHVGGLLVVGALWARGAGDRAKGVLARPLGYATGAAGMALAIGLAVTGGGPVREAGATRYTTPVVLQPDRVAAAGGSGSRRLFSSAPGAAVRSFLTVEPFELRHEVMLRLAGLAETTGLGESSVVEIANQAALIDSLAAFVLENTSVTVDGTIVEPHLRRADFMTVDPTGALPRPRPVPEPVTDAVVGIVVAYPVDGMARTARLTWRTLPVSITSIPATVIDPESVIQGELSTGRPTIEWVNNLSEDPIPSVSSVPVEPARVSVPWSSLPFLLFAVLLFVEGWRRRRPAVAAGARIAVALAVVAGPQFQTAVALPGTAGRTPSERQARRILAGILPNVYRAMEFREESAVYDRLSQSLTGATLGQVYLELRRGLELEERGGAQARVEAVDVVKASEIEMHAGGFWVLAVWNVGGMVTHFGHRHFRQNRYEARIGVVGVDGTWKIESLEVLDLERIR